jgi:hypothetical protein
MASSAQPVQCVNQKAEERVVFFSLSRKSINQFDNVESGRGTPQIVTQGQETLDGLTLANDVKALGLGQQHLTVDKLFHMSAHLAFGTSHSFSYRPDLTQIRSVKGEDAVCFTQLGFPENHCFGVIEACRTHCDRKPS